MKTDEQGGAKKKGFPGKLTLLKNFKKISHLKELSK